LRGRGVVPNHNTPQNRGFVIQLFSLVPRRNFSRRQLLAISFSRWCRRRLLLKPKVAGSSPALDANSGSSWQSVGKHRSRLFPGAKHQPDETLVHNQKKSRWRRRRLLRLISRRRGFDPRTGCKFRKLCGQSAVISLLPLVPRLNNLRHTRLEMQGS